MKGIKYTTKFKTRDSGVPCRSVMYGLAFGAELSLSGGTFGVSGDLDHAIPLHMHQHLADAAAHAAD